jgi:superfamily II DNA/RNA helicase
MYQFTRSFIMASVLLANRMVMGRLSTCAKLRSSSVSIHKSFGTSSLAFQSIATQHRLRSFARQNALIQHQQIVPFRHRIQPLSLSSTVQEDDTLKKLTNTTDFFASNELYPDFASLGITSPALLSRLTSPPLNLARPSSIQAASYNAIFRGDNVIVGAETGTGKTLAYLLPLVEDVLRRKREWKARCQSGEVDTTDIMDPGYTFARAIILVPNKELAHQAIRMASSICGGLDKCVIWGSEGVMAGTNMKLYDENRDESVPEEDIVRLALLPGGLAGPYDYPPFRYANEAKAGSAGRQPPPDLVFATPANLGPMALSPKNIDLFTDVETLVIDEADMLLDGGYVRQLNNVLMGFKRADRLTSRYEKPFRKKNRQRDGSVDNVDEEGEDKPKTTQHVFVAATIPDMGLRSVDAYLRKKFPNALKITMAGMHNARHYGLEQESQTIWNELDENQERMKRLVDVLRLDRSEVGVDGRGLKEEKVMVFLNTVTDVDGATNGLR